MHIDWKRFWLLILLAFVVSVIGNLLPRSVETGILVAFVFVAVEYWFLHSCGNAEIHHF